jgi:hypothetical protein
MAPSCEIASRRQGKNRLQFSLTNRESFEGAANLVPRNVVASPRPKASSRVIPRKLEAPLERHLPLCRSAALPLAF